jgi:hypothetical protein
MDPHAVEIVGLLVIAAAAALSSLKPREEAPEPVPVRTDDERADR